MYFDRRLWAFTRGARWRVCAGVAVGLVAACVGVVRLALLGWLLARVLGGEPLNELWIPIGLVAGIMALRGVFEYWRNMLAHETAAHIQLVLRKRLYEKIVALGPAYFGLQRTGGALLSVIEGVEQLEVYFGQYLPQLFVCLVVPLAIFALVAALDLPVACVMLAFALLTLFGPALFHRFDSANAIARQQAYAAFGAEFLDSVQGLSTLQAFGQSRARGQLLADKAQTLFERTMWVLATNSLTRGITDTGIAAGAAAMLGLGAYRVSAGAMSMQALIMILMMGIEVFRPLRELRALLHDGMMGRSAAQGILDLLAAEPLIRDPGGACPHAARTLAPTVEFDGVSFTYPGTTRHAHRSLSFRVGAGERVALVGSSGCGKTSVVRLLLRLYDPQHGSVSLGGHDLRSLGAADIHAQIAVVNQDTYLFHGTVAQNLRVGKPEASAQELVAAAKAANAERFIRALPQGFDTVVGERGIRLSGGQRQRIAIARALLRDAPILILDEALSAVDAHNEALIHEALEHVMSGRTTLIFAHRLSSVIGADRILVLDHGRVVESGTHAELMREGGVYFDLMAHQAQSAGAPGSIEARCDPAASAGSMAATAEQEHTATAYLEPTDAILRAEGIGWLATLRAMLAMIAPWKGRLALTLALGIARVLALIGVGVLSALVVAALMTQTPFDTALAWLAVTAPLAGLLHWLESWIAHDMAFRLLAALRVGLFRKLDALGPAYLMRRRSGDLVAMATHDVEMLEFFFAHTVAPAFVAVLVPGAVLATLTVYGVSMALALAPFLALVALSPFVARHRIDALGSQAREALGSLNAHVVDTIQGLNEVIAFEQVQRRGRAFVELIHTHHRVRLPFFRDITVQMAILEVATGLGGLAVVLAGGRLTGAGVLDDAMLPLLTLLAMAAFLPVSEIAHIGRQLAETLGATRRLHAVDNEPVLVTDGPGIGERAVRTSTCLGMSHVDFTYFGRTRPALEGVSFSVEAGTTLALVGPSGAGKSTAAHLLMRFFDPDTGRVQLLGHDLRDYPLADLREHIALVTQDTYLFNDTMGNNIRMARPTASDGDVADAVKRAALGPFVSSLPQGLETAVGERGVRLSGGQRQRVAIARAFLKDAPVLILDEATSHLDATSERLVHRALGRLMSDRTTVLIAHRLSTVRNAHTIVVLSEGKLVETGTHEELMAEGGLYRQLVMGQMAGAGIGLSAA